MDATMDATTDGMGMGMGMGMGWMDTFAGTGRCVGIVKSELRLVFLSADDE